MSSRGTLNDQAIKRLVYEGKTIAKSDGRGLYLETRATGKYWRFKYSFGKQKWLYIGAYPEVSLKEAREHRDEARMLVRKGIDPAANRRDVKRERKLEALNEFHTVANEWFERKMADKSAKHRDRTRGYLENQLAPLKGRRIGEIRPSDLTAIFDNIEKKGTYNTARRVLRVATLIFEYGYAREYFSGTLPTVGLADTLTAVPKARNRAAVTNPVELAPILRKMHSYEGSIQVETALKLQPILFCRPGELRRMEWTEVDWKAKRWTIPADKMKTDRDFIIPLSTQAETILAELREHTGHRQYAFPSARRPTYPMSDAAVLVAMRSIGIEKDQQTPHGFRATARTLLEEELGYRVEVIEMQLAHAVRDPTGRAYNRTQFLKDRTSMMQAWADYIDTVRRSSNR